MAKKKAFTLIELLMVIAIIGVLAALVIVSIVGAQKKAKDTQKKNNARTISSALSQYQLDNKEKYPIETTDGGAAISSGSNIYTALVTNGNYLKAAAFSSDLTAKYSSPDGTSFTLGFELSSPTEGTISVGNGVYASDPYVAGLYSPPSKSRALEMIATSSCTVSGAQQAGYMPSSNLSVSMWIYRSVVPGTDMTVISMYNSTLFQGYRTIITRNSGTDRILFYTGDGVSAKMVLSDALNSLNTPGAWYHVVVTLSGGTGYIYINGEQAGTSSALATSLTYNASQLLYVGNQGGGACFQGKIDDLRIYNQAIPQASGTNGGVNVRDIYNSGRGKFNTSTETSLTAGFRFNEGTGTTATGYVNAAHTLTWGSTVAGWGVGIAPLGLSGLTTGALPSNRAYITYGPQ